MVRVAFLSMILPVMAACSPVDAGAPQNNAHANLTGDESLTQDQLERLQATRAKAAALSHSCRASWTIGGQSRAYEGRGASEGEAQAAARIACTRENPGDANRLGCLGTPEPDRWDCSTAGE